MKNIKKNLLMKQVKFVLIGLFLMSLSGCTNNEEQMPGITEVNIFATTGSNTGSIRSTDHIVKESFMLANGLWVDMIVTEEPEMIARAQQEFSANIAILANVYEGTNLITTIHYQTETGGKVTIESGENYLSGFGVIERNGRKVLVLPKGKNYRFVAYTDMTSATPNSLNVYSQPVSENGMSNLSMNVMNFSGELNTNEANVTLTAVFKRVLCGLRLNIISRHKRDFTVIPTEIRIKEGVWPTSTNWDWSNGTYNATTFNTEEVKYTGVQWTQSRYSVEGSSETTDSRTMEKPITMLPGALNNSFELITSQISIGDFHSKGDVNFNLTQLPKMEGGKSYKVQLFIKADGDDIVFEGENGSGSEPV